MVSTCDQTIVTAQRIVGKVLNCGVDSRLEKALAANNLMDIADWMHLTTEILESLFYEDNGARVQLEIGIWLKIRQFTSVCTPSAYQWSSCLI
jgi:hypothetical protein